MYNVVKAELISNKSEWSMGVEANASESKCVKLTLENPDDWQDEGGVFIFFQEQSPRIFERWAKVFEDLGNNVIEGESIPERFRVMKNVVIDWYNLPEPCFKKYDKKIYHKGNLIHNIGDTIVDKTGNTKVYTKVKIVSYKVARGEDGELVWAFDPDVIIQKMIGRIYFPMSTLSSKPAADSKDDVADEEEQQLTCNLILWKHILVLRPGTEMCRVFFKITFRSIINYTHSLSQTLSTATQCRRSAWPPAFGRSAGCMLLGMSEDGDEIISIHPNPMISLKGITSNGVNIQRFNKIVKHINSQSYDYV